MTSLLNIVYNEKAQKISKKVSTYLPFVLLALCVLNSSVLPTLAVGYEDVVKSIINLIGNLFKVVGVILMAYSVGQLVLAFKNEDADSKTRATTQLVVGAALIALPFMIEQLKLEELIPKQGELTKKGN